MFPSDRPDQGPPPPVTVRGVVLAGHRGDREAVLAALGNSRPEVRHAALGAARRLDLLDDDRLLAAAGDDDAGVRRRAVELAGRLADPSPRRLRCLVRALGDVDTVAEAAAFALGELGRADAPVVDALVAMARHHHDALCREAAVAALGALGDGLDAILAALEADRATVRRRAVLALAPFDDPRVEAALHRAAQDRDWQVRQAAEDLLAP